MLQLPPSFHFLEEFSKIRANLNRHNRVYIHVLSSRHSYPPMGACVTAQLYYIIIIIHQTHYEKSDWSRAFNQFTIACELDMINAISAADSAFIMSSSSSAWLLSPLECSPQKQNG